MDADDDPVEQIARSLHNPCSLVYAGGRPDSTTATISSVNDVTRILSAIEQGDPRAAEELLPLVYQELRKLAAAKLAQEKPGQTIQATVAGTRGVPAAVEPTRLSRGIAVGISSPPPRRECGESSWRRTSKTWSHARRRSDSSEA